MIVYVTFIIFKLLIRLPLNKESLSFFLLTRLSIFIIGGLVSNLIPNFTGNFLSDYLVNMGG